MMASRRPLRRDRGVTLIELLVGVVIGMVATLAIAQVLALAEGQKRSTTSGTDAQLNGALSLYALQRDIASSGYGLTKMISALNCPIRGRWGATDLGWTLAPVVITDGAANAPDTITTLTAVRNGPVLPSRIVSNHVASDTDFLVATNVDILPGDLLLAVPQGIDAANWCSLLTATAVTNDAAGHHVTHLNAPNNWNPAPANHIFPTGGYNAGGYLLNLGNLQQRVYSVNLATRSLQEVLTDLSGGPTPGAAADLYPQVVDLQAFYGKDTNLDGAVDTYDAVTPTTQAGWAQVRAIRLAVVTRSAQFEKEVVTSAQPTWDVGSAVPVAGAAACGASQCVTMKVDFDADWQHYRYRVFESVVPLRNVLWSET